MERKSYITRRFNQILNETINEKANELMGKLKFNPPGTSFDYVQEGKNMCNECGKPYTIMAEVVEGETCECGDPYSIEVKEMLIGGQRKLDKNKNNKIDAEDFKLLRKGKKEMREYTMGDDKLEVVKPYGDMSTDSPNIKPGKKNQVKNVGFDYQKKVAKKFDDYELDESEAQREIDMMDDEYGALAATLGMDPREVAKYYPSKKETQQNERPKPQPENPRQTGDAQREIDRMNDEYGALAASLGMDPREVAMYYPNKKDETNETIYELELDETETDEGNAFTGMLKKTKKGDSFELDGKKYTDRSSLEEKWEGDVEVKQTGEYSDMSIEELNSAIKKLKAKTDKVKEDGKKVSHADRTKMSQLYFAKRAKQGWKGKGKAKVEETYYRIKVDGEMATFSENEMIDIIESIVKEEKTNIKTSKQPAGYAEYVRVHKADGKEEEKYFKDLAKKMTDYIKDGSKQKKFDTNPTQFPKGNGELGEMDKKAYEIDQEGKDFNYEVGGLNIPDYDEIKPKKETIEKQIKGSSTNGNDQSYANAVNTGVNDKFAEYFENDQLAKWKDESYGRVPSPVYADNPSKSKGKGKTKLKEEFSRMQQLMGYNQKTQ